ncbi:MAG: SulP family inorganic anion transporter [Desulfobacterales bacterium]|nr:MAG: SulP family inorganic anion transporter [Desulfobacterales bacterium]
MLKKIFPFLGWFEYYSPASLKIDLISGLTVALVLIPQSMAYAQLAGLPPYYGLYASFLPPMIAALFGSSLQLATGPVAMVSLMTSVSLAPLASTGSQGYVAYAILLALMVGVFQFGLGVLRLGVVVNFLSHPVVNGFTNAAAIIIASSQLSKMFGVYVDAAGHHYETIIQVIKSTFHYTHWPTLFMGVFAFVLMYGLKRIAPKIPNVLVAVVLTTFISWATGFEHNTTVDTAAIESAKVRELITNFNAALAAITSLAEERTEVTRRIEEARRAHDTIRELDAQRDAGVIAIQIDELDYKAHLYREELRNFFFRGVPQADGAVTFYLRDEVPPGAQADGRNWRLRVGNKPLATQSLIIMGGGEVVGTIPRGLPALSLPQIDFSVLARLFPYAVIISLLGFMEAISIAKAMAGKTGQRLDPNQELIGQGLANIVGAIGKSYPTSGSFSRSAVNLQSGAISGLSSVFTSLAVVIMLLFFTPLLYHLPQSVLAAVIMMAVIGLVNVSGFIHAWHSQWYDGAISIISFVSTLAFAPHLDKGIMIGVILSLLVFLYKSMRPNVASLARYEDEALRCAFTHGLKECEYIALIRFDGPLFFANSSYLEDQIMDRMRARKNLKHIIIAANGINDIDASGQDTLSLLVDRVRSAGIDISFSGVNESVMEVLRRTHLDAKIGEDHIYPTMEKAIGGIHEETHVGGIETDCPLTTVCRLTAN